jgi:hypothetical protein
VERLGETKKYLRRANNISDASAERYNFVSLLDARPKY